MDQRKNYLVVIFLLLILQLSQSLSTNCNPADDALPVVRLRSKLFCNYDHLLRPVKQRGANITVKISLDLKYISIDEHSSQMNVHSWVVTVWKDDYLSWDSAEYDNTTSLVVSSDDIWLPDIAIFNSDLTQIMLFSSTTCMLYNTGILRCAPDLRTPVYCNPNLKRWPYDTQNCSLYLGSWAHAGEAIDVELDEGKGYHSYLYMESKAWQLLDVKARKVSTGTCCPKATHVYLSYNFVLKRHAALYAATIVVPAFVLAALAASSFLVRGIVCRTCVCCTAIVGDALFLQYIGFHLPADGDTSPDIVAYYRDAMLLAVISLVISMTVEGLRNTEVSKTSSTAPQWLAGVASWLRGSGGRAGQLLLGDSDVEQDAEATPAVRDAAADSVSPRWNMFATLIDRTSFLALTITYIILLLALLP